MLSDLELRFHNAQEFTLRNDSHKHCIVVALIPETASYDIIHTSNGKIQRVSEKELVEMYMPSTIADKCDALLLLGSDIKLDGLVK